MALVLPNSPTIPRYDAGEGLSAVGSFFQNLGDQRRAKDYASQLVGDSAPQQSGGFLSGLLPKPPSSAPQTAAVAPVQRGDLQGTTFKPFISTVQAGGLTNPYGLAAVAATGRAESGWSAKNAGSTWSDPSESGQPGTAGGVLSWRGPRYEALAATGDLSPEGQARFFLQENPDLIQKLQNANSIEEAQQLMNGAWRFAGYDKPGGESARRLALANAYYKNEFANAPNGGAAAIEAVAPLEQGDSAPEVVAGYRDPMVSAPNSRAAADPVSQRYTMGSSTASVTDGAPIQAENAVARAQPRRITGELLGNLITNPYTRDLGLAIGKTVFEGRKQGYDFMMGQNGDLIRTDNQGGVTVVGNFGKSNEKFQVVSPEERQALGIPETDQRIYQRGPNGQISAVGGAGQTINVGNEVEARRQAAAQAGLTEKDPAYQGFILTGKLPRENEQSLTATDKKAILEADEMVQNTQNVLPLIQRALDLNDKAYSGPTAGIRGIITGAAGYEGGEATQELDNVVIAGALTQLKAIFGGAPTEGERQILLNMSGASSKPAAVRKTIFERARQAAERRLNFYQQRANDLRGGTFYKPNQSGTTQSPEVSDDIKAARAAIQRGAPRDAVIKRLQDAGIDTEGL